MTAQITLPKAIFFDWDGTLVDSFIFLRQAHSHVRNAFGLPDITQEQFDTYFGMPRELLYKEIYAENMEKAKSIFEEYVLENHKNLEPMPGAEELLKAVFDMGITMGTVSNKKGGFMLNEIKHFGWQDYFVSCIGAGDAKEDKPAPDSLFMAIEKGNVKADIEDIWYVGDTETDLKCAQAAKCPSVFIQHKDDNRGLADKYKPILMVRDCHELHEFLLQNVGK